jgi:HSP20 family protein
MNDKSKETQEEKDEKGVAVETETPARMLSPFEEMDRMFENLFPRRWMQPMRWDIPHWPELAELKAPKVDIIDRETEIVVKAELPGVAKEDIDLSITDNTVTIKGSTSHENKEERGNYYRCEISRGSFSRTLALPSDVNAEDAKASFVDGILELTIPKEKKSHRKNITIK